MLDFFHCFQRNSHIKKDIGKLISDFTSFRMDPWENVYVKYQEIS